MRRFADLDMQSGATTEAPAAAIPSLADARKGFCGVIVQVCAPEDARGLGGDEIERRLLEMGFVEGAPVRLTHEGLIGRDPIAVRLADRTVALRRREARSVLVRATAGA
ncbi:MAG TPA: FeoA family protein [Caulobacteraceae bacterium]|nr:FeoA family protein [Caulobacteraceae bacterium]